MLRGVAALGSFLVQRPGILPAHYKLKVSVARRATLY